METVTIIVKSYMNLSAAGFFGMLLTGDTRPSWSAAAVLLQHGCVQAGLVMRLYNKVPLEQRSRSLRHRALTTRAQEAMNRTGKLTSLT